MKFLDFIKKGAKKPVKQGLVGLTSSMDRARAMGFKKATNLKKAMKKLSK